MGRSAFGISRDKRMPPGGYLAQGDRSMAAAAVRKAKEEFHIDIDVWDRSFRLLAICLFDHLDVPRRNRVGYYFIGQYTGVVRASQELIDPQMYQVRRYQLPLAEMWPADRLWVPPVLERESQRRPIRLMAHILIRRGRVVGYHSLDERYFTHPKVPIIHLPT